MIVTMFPSGGERYMNSDLFAAVREECVAMTFWSHILHVTGYRDVLHDLATEFIYKVPWIVIGQGINTHELLADHLMPRGSGTERIFFPKRRKKHLCCEFKFTSYFFSKYRICALVNKIVVFIVGSTTFPQQWDVFFWSDKSIWGPIHTTSWMCIGILFFREKPFGKIYLFSNKVALFLSFGSKQVGGSESQNWSTWSWEQYLSSSWATLFASLLQCL
jgi:hypothetical protein